MSKTRPIRSSAAARRQRDMEAERRRRVYATKDNFLRSQGPLVIDLDILDGIQLKFLMRRVDLLALCRSSESLGWPAPITAVVRRLVANGGIPKEDDLVPEREDDLVGACAAIAKACIICVPEAFANAEIELEDITPAMCKPFFVDEDPDEDQVVLQVLSAEEAAGMSLEEIMMATSAGHLQPTDLMRIAALAYKYGPGGIGGYFREKSGEAVVPVDAVEADAAAA